jgi:hypothetical protein
MEAAARAPEIPATERPDEKVKRDLATVQEKINLATAMLEPLNSSAEVDANEALLSVIGFLEACIPRVRELVEAGMSGALQEDTLVKCLGINDNLLQILEFVENPKLCIKSDKSDTGGNHKEPPVPPTNDFDAFAIGDDDDDDDDFNDFMAAGDSKPAAAPTNTTTSTVLDELLLAPDPQPTESHNSTKDTDSAQKSNITDEFDDFFGERTNETKFQG